MAFAADYDVLFDRLDEELRAASRPARGLFAKIVGSACTRLPVLSNAGAAARIGRLIAAGALTEAALALIELEIPAWKIRRLVCEGGEWFCSLSRQPNLPMALDDSVEATHGVLPLAILRAFLEARRRSSVAAEPVSTVPRVRPCADEMVCCDNFA
jgi:hypothetical protein